MRYLLMFLMSFALCFGATITSDGAPLNWNDTASWDLGRLPIAGDDVVIAHAIDLDIAETPALLSIKNTTTGTLTVNGNEIINATTIQATGNNSTACLTMSGSGDVVINGNIVGHAAQSNGHTIISTATGTITVNGNVTASASFGMDINGACTVTINGNVSGASNHGIDTNLTTTLTITGRVTGGDALAYHAVRMVTADSTLSVGTVVYTSAKTAPLEVNVATISISAVELNGTLITGGNRSAGGRTRYDTR